MSLNKLKNVYFLGSLVKNIKGMYDKINEIIDYLNGDGKSGDGSYKSYVALLTQSGTSAPTVTILENTLGTIVWTRLSAGNYYGTLSDAFVAGKTIIVGNSNAEYGDYYSYNPLGGAGNVAGYYGFARDSKDVILFQTISSSTNNAVEASVLLTGSTTVPLEIRVYN